MNFSDCSNLRVSITALIIAAICYSPIGVLAAANNGTFTRTGAVKAENKRTLANRPNHRLLLNPIDFAKDPTAERLMSAGQLGGLLYPTDYAGDEQQNKGLSVSAQSTTRLDRVKRRKTNRSFGRAIEAWNTHQYTDAAKLFSQHIKEFPNSPWAAESELHMACDARYQGRYADAEAKYLSILEKNRGKKALGAQRLANKARLRLGALKSLQNNFGRSAEYFSALSVKGSDWRDRTYASHWLRRLSSYQAQEAALLNCGYLALGYLLDQQGKVEQANTVRGIKPTSLDGQSLAELKNIAGGYGYTLSGLRVSIDEIDQIPLPAIVQIQGKDEGDSGHFWILKQKRGEILSLHDPQSRRHFRQTATEFQGEWDGVVLVFSSDVASLPGVQLTTQEMADLTGGCCGLARQESDLGKPGGDDGCGECVWSVDPVSMNFFMTDTPLWYRPPTGPSVAITLNYNSQSALAYHEPFGNKWQFNYGSYLVLDPGNAVTIFMPDGRRDLFTGDGAGNYTPPAGVYNSLTNTAANRWELRFPDDTVFVYDIPSGTSSQQPFLVALKDAYGQGISFSYNSSVQLTTITDAVGQVSTLTYNANGLVEKVTDPFGREALFTYDANDNLTQITDMGGYWSRMTYDADVYVTSIEKADGLWQVWVEPADSSSAGYYNPPGTPMWANYRITVTNPDGGKEEYFYDGYHRKGWYVSPNDYVEYVDSSISNGASSTPKTKYAYSTYSGSKGKVSRITYPGQGSVSYSFDSNGNTTRTTDANNKYFAYTYNALGYPTSITDPKGNVTQFVYAANNVDLLSIQDGRGATLFEYNAKHSITQLTDRKGNKTAYTYNGLGQPLTSTLAKGTADEVVVTFVYDANQRLQSIKRAGQIRSQFTYDAMGRVLTETDATGLARTYAYDPLNQVAKITYPDGKFETFTYSSKRPFLLEKETARSGRSNQYLYDPEKRLSSIVNAELGLLRQEYDANGNLVKRIDPNSNTTQYSYDRDNLVTAKTYADGVGSAFVYDTLGRIKTRTNARGVVTTYSYDANSSLTAVDYSDTTPDIALVYDSYNRLVQRTDGLGVSKFYYDANDNLTAVDGPWANDTVTYQYDAMNRRVGMTPTGGDTVSWSYDNQGRIIQVSAGGRNYQYAYQGVSSRVKSLTRPNSSITKYQYDSLSRLTQLSNEKGNGTVINRFDYSYNTEDLRGVETITNGNPITGFQNELITYDTNKLNQLLTSTNPAKSYQYDADGNMTRGYTPGGYLFAAVYDTADRLSTIEYTDGGGVVRKTEYRYGGDGFIGRVLTYENSSQTSDTRFVRNGLLALQERNGSNAVTRQYAWGLSMGGGIGGLLELKQSGQNYSYLYNGKGNVAALLDDAQSVMATYTYDAYGQLMSKTGSLDQPYQFSTKRHDEALGLNYFGYRFYSAGVGRWLNRDPIGETGGIGLYTYAGNNPPNFIDPLGLILQYADTASERAMKAHINRIMKSAKGRELIKKLRDDPKTYFIHGTRGEHGPAYQLGNHVYVDPSFKPKILTDCDKKKKQVASTTRILAHELGHLTGTKDDGANSMNNVNKWENPIMSPLERYKRTKY